MSNKIKQTNEKEEIRINNYNRKILICTTLDKRFKSAFILVKYPDSSPGLIFGVVNWKLISNIKLFGEKTFCTLFGQDNCIILKIGTHSTCLIAFTKYQIHYSNRECLEKNNPLIQKKINQYLNH